MSEQNKSITSKNLFYTDSHLMLVTRVVGLGFSTLLALIETLVKLDIISVGQFHEWAYWATVIGFMLTGLLLFFWTPLTREKNKIWLLSYVFFGVIVSSLVLGFSTIIFLGWLVLIIAMGMMISASFSIIGYLGLLLSLVLWLGLVIRNPSAGLVAENLVDVAAVILTVALVEGIWLLASRLIIQIERSRKNESRERQRLNTLINDMLEGVLAIDASGKVTNYNAAALNVLDVNGSLENRSLSGLLKPEDSTGKKINLLAYIKALDKPVVRTDLKLSYDDGSKISLFLAIAPVRAGYGKRNQEGFTLILRDITREKSLEEERDEFISVVSHELRTPVAIAEGNISNAQFVLSNAKSGNRGELINKSIDEAHTQVLFLADMINDLSTLSRAERGKLDVEIADIDVVKFLVSLHEDYLPEAKQRNLKLALKYNPKIHNLHSSQLYVREILQNFITNALKYTEKGGVTIEANGKPGGVEFAITDTGIGLSKQDKAKVFDKFFRSEDFRTRKTNGTGLGLYVTMKLAKLLQAEPAVESKLNSGTTFRIYFPDLQSAKNVAKKS